MNAAAFKNQRPNNFRAIFSACVAILSMAAICRADTNGAPPATAGSITQYGITWTFDKPHQVGRYITGDWWVVGPVTVVSVTPEPVPGRNGSEVNPPAGEKLGYDDRLHGFDATLRAAFPLELKPSQSLVSTVSVDKLKVKTPDTVPDQHVLGPLRTAAVLTCVDAPPPPDAFRPAYVGTWKETFIARQIHRELLPKLKSPVAPPDCKIYERELERIWLDHQREFFSRDLHPLENMPDYGREIMSIGSTVGLMLLLDDPDGKYNTLLLRFIQKGIDYYGTVLSNADLWRANGGHDCGRKWPILFAGLMLNNDGMKHVKAVFQEDDQTYYGNCWTGAKVCWGMFHKSNPEQDHEQKPPQQWTADGRGKQGDPAASHNSDGRMEAYRLLNGPVWVGTALAARLTGMMDTWNHPAFFDYMDRWMYEDYNPIYKAKMDAMDSADWVHKLSIERQETSDSPFVDAMWATYRPTLKPPADGWKTEHHN